MVVPLGIIVALGVVYVIFSVLLLRTRRTQKREARRLVAAISESKLFKQVLAYLTRYVKHQRPLPLPRRSHSIP
jgi:hypothetical protein